MQSKKTITVVGTGYVGLVTGVSLAHLGHHVVCVGRDKQKIQKINSGISPFFEPGLDSFLKKLTRKKLLIATDNLQEAVRASSVILLAVGTPTRKGSIDLSEIKVASKQIGQAMRSTHRYRVVIVKSTVVPGTTESVVKKIIESHSHKTAGKDFGLCMIPEFLREGNAVSDAMHPDRIVIGEYDQKSGAYMVRVLKKFSCPIVRTTLKTAEMIKYTANSLLATMISFANEVSRIAEDAAGVDVVDVWKGVHLDRRLSPVVGNKRIRPDFLTYILSGCGYGGSCFPKDTKALAHFSKSHGYTPHLIKHVISINETQPQRLVYFLIKELGSLHHKRIAVWGITFKPNTDDIRESPALSVISLLKQKGADVVCHDPVLGKIKGDIAHLSVIIQESAKESIRGADGLIVVTAWDEYKQYTPAFFTKYMKRPVLVDGRRMFKKEVFQKGGVIYRGIGLGGI